MDESIKEKVRNNPDVPRERLVKIARIKGDSRKHKAVDDLLAELTEAETEKKAEEPSSAKRTRGQIVAESLVDFTNKLDTFVTEEYALRFSPADRDLIAAELKSMQQKIETILEGMSQEKDKWDKLYADKKAKPQGKKPASKSKKTKANKKS